MVAKKCSTYSRRVEGSHWSCVRTFRICTMYRHVDMYRHVARVQDGRKQMQYVVGGYSLVLRTSICTYVQDVYRHVGIIWTGMWRVSVSVSPLVAQAENIMI
ncbi:unnamed protein product, partial [Laminaria digitata]